MRTKNRLGSDAMDIVIDFENYTDRNSIFKRTAAREIVSNGDKYLLITSKYGDYKFLVAGWNLVKSL